MNFLLDTNVISELMNGMSRCDEGVAAWFAAVSDDSIYLSVLVLGEIRRGVEAIRRRDLTAAEALDTWLTRVRDDYSGRVLGVDAQVPDLWGRINVPDPVPAIDGLLAATALVHDMTLVTRNIRDVVRTGVTCLNPFST